MIILFARSIADVVSVLKRGSHGSEVKWMAEGMNNEGLEVTGHNKT